MTEITVWSALAGGSMIGGASALLFYKQQRIAGISGIAAGILPPWNAESGWRLCFLLGLLSSAPLYRLSGQPLPIQIDAHPALLAVAGLLVGYGSRLGGGCTSGHGVCGIARLSVRSIVATLIFMATAGVAVYLLRHLL
ncbi:MAG: YeeE/YedE family protein [Methylococcales bacterium]|nr:YeeE/YedE family protein [Methylococcales bacterium]